MTNAGRAGMPGTGESAGGRTRSPLLIACFAWAMAVTIQLAMQWPAIAALDFSDPDDAMRMAQVRDLLAGQGWWDLHQYRVNPADGGVLMHWSRIVDAPIALGVLILRPLLGPADGRTGDDGLLAGDDGGDPVPDLRVRLS